MTFTFALLAAFLAGALSMGWYGRQRQQRALQHNDTSMAALEQALLRSEKEKQTLLETAPVNIIIASLESGKVIFVNQHMANELGFDEPSELMQEPMRRFYADPEERRRIVETLQRDGHIELREVAMLTRHNQPWWNLTSCRLMSLESEQVIFAAGINITRQKDTERALRESEQKFLKLVEGAPCASFVFELANAQILLLNQMARELLALPSFQALSANVRDLFHVPADVQALLDDLQRHQVVRDREIQIRNAYGEAQWFHLSATLIEYEGRMVALCAMLNIEMRRRAELELLQARVDSEHANRELRAANIELERLAATDRLTQSYNRRYFEEVAINEISRSRRYNVPLAVIVMDLDHFKAVNDQYGHAMGDTVLIEFSRVIRQKLRTSDTFARWGGEEFLVLATSTGLDEANILAEKLRELWAEHRVENLPPVTLSAGVTLLSYKDTLDTFIRRADAALYRAKSEGRNRVVSIGPDALVH